MSRRSRKRNAAGENRWLGKCAVGLLGAAVVLLAVGYFAMRGYLHSDSFRKFLSVEAGEMAGVSGEFAPFSWQGLAVDTENFAAVGDGIVREIRAEGLHTEVGFGGLGRGVWEVHGTRVRRIEATLDLKKATREAGRSLVKVQGRKPKPKPAGKPWLPREAELQEIEINQISATAALDEGEASLTGATARAEMAGAPNSYRGEILGGTVRLPFDLIPELRLEEAKLRFQNRQIFLTRAKIGLFDQGSLEATGEWDLRSGKYSLQGDADALRCEEILSPSWAKRLSGKLTSNFEIENRAAKMQASGKLKITEGALTALPMLDALAAYADTRRFRTVPLNQAEASWRWTDGELILTDMILSSDGLIRLEGSLTRRGKRIDGVFRLGLMPGTLARIPGAETDVFTQGERGLMWAPVRVTGTVDDPKEDLTERLIAAAGFRMLEQIPETGAQVLKFTRPLLGDRPVETIERGVEILEQGSRTVGEVRGILGSILGEEPKKVPADDLPH